MIVVGVVDSIRFLHFHFWYCCYQVDVEIAFFVVVVVAEVEEQPEEVVGVEKQKIQW